MEPQEDEEDVVRVRRSSRIANALQAIAGGTTGQPSGQAPSEQDEYVVDKIVNHREEGDGTLSYLVKWYGYASDQNTWEQITNLRRSMIERYFRRKKMQCPEDLDLAIEG